MARWRLPTRLRSDLHTLRGAELGQALAVCARNPVESVMAAELIAALRASRSPFGEVWSTEPSETTQGVCWVGANLSPVGHWDEADLDELAVRSRGRARRCSSIVGTREIVEPLWDRLAPWWGPARELRMDQPSLVMEGDPHVPADPYVREVTLADLDVLFPAAVAMFTEEVGFSPLDASGSYRRRCTDLIRQRRCFAHFGGPGEPPVLFKADVGALYGGVAQIQGVWVAPEARRMGLGTAGMAAVVDMVRSNLAPTVSLYVNGFNTAALATYAKVGFRQVGTFSTVLL